MTTPLRVLIVEDNPDDAELMILELSRGGFDPRWRRVETADEMRAALAGEPWDIVLSDYTLPQFGALAALAVARDFDPDLPFVVVSGTVGEAVAVAAMRAGASDYVLKQSLARLAPAVGKEVREAENRRARRRAERAAAHLAALVECSGDAIISKTLDGAVTSWNPAAERLYGWTAAEAVGRHISFLVPEDRREELAGIMELLRRGQRVEHFETVRLHRDGTRIDVALTISPVRDGSNCVVGASKIARDIRESKRAERRAAAILESMGEAFAVLDPGWRFAYVNAAFERIIGVRREDVVGLSHWEMFPATVGTPLEAEYRRVAATGGTAEFEFHYGSWGRWFAVKAYPSEGGGVCVQLREVTEARRAEEALRESEERYRAVVEDQTEVVCRVRADRTLAFVNGGFCRLVGKTPGELVGHRGQSIAHPDDVPVVEAALATLSPANPVARVENRVVDATGGIRWMEFVNRGFFGPGGDLREFQAVGRDITERRQAEHALRESEARLVRAQAVAKVGSWETDLSTMEVAWSPETYRLFEVSPDQKRLTHQRFLEFVHPDDRAAVDEAFRRSFEHCSPCEVVHRIVLPDGTIKVLEEHWQRQADGQGTPVRVVGTCQDITQRKQAEDAIRDSEERYRTLVAATAAVVWGTPSSGEFDSHQPAWTAFTGQTMEQHRGWGWLDALHPDDREGSARAWTAAVAGRHSYAVEHRLRRADGEYRWMSVRAVPILDRGGAVREWVGVHTDVTDQRRAHEAMRESEERYRRLADAMPQIVWATRPDGYHEFYNRQWYDYTGLTFGETEGEGWNRVFHPDDQALAWERWRHSLATGETYEIEYRCRRHDGEYRWFLGRAVPQRDEGSRVVRWFGTCTDIHDFKNAEMLLREKEARLAEAVQIARMGYWNRDLATGGLDWSDELYGIFGVDPAAFGGTLESFLATVLPEDRDRARRRIAEAEAGAGSFNHNYRILARGEVRVIHEVGRVMSEGGRPVRVAGTAQDVTERTRAEETLRLRDRAIGAATQGIVITDPGLPGNPVVYASPGFERMTGYGAEEAVGRNCRFLQGKDTEPDAVARMRRAVLAGEPCTSEVLNYRKDGTPFWNELSISPVRDAEGRLTHFVGVLADVTARRGLEQQYRQAQKMEAFGQLAGGVAHDFNNLLTIINGYSSLLLMRMPPGDPGRGMLEEICHAGGRSASLTRQLLAFSRRQAVQPRVVGINGVVADAEKMLRRLIGEDVRLRAVLAPAEARVKADPGQLEQVLMNLAVNARDAMPTGGDLTIETGEAELDEEYAAAHDGVRAGRYALVAVSDTGCGMTPEVRDRVFEPFFTTKEQGKGTGLGLAVVHGIVKDAGGHVGVYSEPGHGTTFKVYLPLAGESAQAAESPSAERRPLPRGDETVLLVEDEGSVRALARHVLAGCGYAVLEAASGKEALRVAEGHSGTIHLLVTDVVMPGLSGRQAAEHLLLLRPTMKVLYVSGYTADAVVRHGIQHDHVQFLQKPFSALALASKVREVLDSPAKAATEAPSA